MEVMRDWDWVPEAGTVMMTTTEVVPRREVMLLLVVDWVEVVVEVVIEVEVLKLRMVVVLLLLLDDDKLKDPVLLHNKEPTCTVLVESALGVWRVKGRPPTPVRLPFLNLLMLLLKGFGLVDIWAELTGSRLWCWDRCPRHQSGRVC